jgi:predicted signal transduction protein with EAL and GGDEF domain
MSTQLEARPAPPAEAAGQSGHATALRGSYLRVVDSWIPETLQHAGGEALRCARIVVGFTLVLLALGLEAVAFFHWSLPPAATLIIDLSLALGLTVTLFIPVTLRHFESVEPAANLVVGASYLVLLSIFLVLGGIRAPVLHWCALVPMLALLMGARRSAWVWAGISLMTLASFAAADVLGLPLPSYLEESGLAGDRLWLQRVVDVGSWVVILIVIGLVYERHKGQQTAELAVANAELKRQILQRHRAEERTRYLAYYDELTSLPNRELFKQQLELAMADAERSDHMIAVMILDLDSFKWVNDSYGHPLGDALLKQVADRLRACVRGADSVFRNSGDQEARAEESVVSRLGGDEFTVLLVKLRNDREAAIVASRMLQAFKEPFSLEDHEVYISASIGIALYPRDVADVNELLRNADLAMYSAKDHGKNNYQFFSESMNEEIVRRTTLTNELRRACERSEFILHYQPIVQAGSREIVGLEALIRWQHPARGLVMPGEFIEIAEESGLIGPISEWVLSTACQQIVEWRDQGLPGVRLAVNLSGVQLRHRGLCDYVEVTLAQTGMDPRDLELEITESAMMEDEEQAARSLVELKQLGLDVALDDFGTGYSSLSYVQRYPVDSLKIDRSFVKEVSVDPEAQAITTAIVAMAHGLGLTVVAEGVETAEQEKFLVELGCDRLQGFRFARPQAAREVAELLRDGLSLGSAATPSQLGDAVGRRDSAAAGRDRLSRGVRQG